MLLDVFTFGYVIASWYTDPYHHELIIFISDNDYCLKLYIATVSIAILSLLWLFVWPYHFISFSLNLSPYIQNVSLNSTEFCFYPVYQSFSIRVCSLFTLSVLTDILDFKSTILLFHFYLSCLFFLFLFFLIFWINQVLLLFYLFFSSLSLWVMHYFTNLKPSAFLTF